MTPVLYPASVTAKEVILCWTPGTDQVALVEWPDQTRASDQFKSTGLACYTHIHELSFEQRKTDIFVAATCLVVRDRCDPMAVHRALSGLKEYCDGCPPDMPVWVDGREIPLGNLFPEMFFSDDKPSC